MACSKFVFYHADLGPGNIIVEDIPETGTIDVIDWELASYFPKGMDSNQVSTKQWNLS